ncbi:MAG: hypothetical protein IKT16_04480, partial [Desulfovibrio sp.]|nr:hypothetical protein [Desulfovibrio sp.]
YRNSFACIPDDVPFRPERRAERAKVSGMLTAFIDGSSDSAVADVNEKGCYRVIFPQDLSGRPNGKSSCWIRRMQPHVGLGHGMTFPLTPGIEVLVAFIDGNPDRPVIAGAVANAVSGASENTATAQSTAIRTAGGSGLVFNDKETKQGLHLGTGGHSGLFMSSGSLDALMAFSDFAGKLASGADTTFAGLAQHAISGFSSKLEANHKSFGIPTAIFEVLKDVSKVTACFDEGFWHAALENHDPDRMVSQCLGTGFEALTDVLKGIPATAEAIIGAGALAATDPFYGASITAKESQAKVALTTPMGPLQIAAYITFSILSWLASFGTTGVKAVASWLSAKQEIQQREKKLLVICLEEEYAAEMRTAHPDWTEEKVRAEATAKAAADVAAKGSSLLAQDKYREAVDAMEKEAGIDFTSLENAKWHRAGRAIAQSAATTLVPELVSIIAVCTKAGKFTSAKSLGGLLLCATDSNAVMGARKETRVSSDEKLFLTAGAGQSVYSRYTQGSTLQNNLEKDFGLDSKDSAVVQRADVLASLALKKSEHTSLGTIAAQAKDAITLTTKYSEADITRALTGCNAELLQASEEVLSHIKEYGTGEASISAAILNALKNMSKLLPKFAVPPTAYTELSLGKSGETQQAKLDCQGAGCTISLAGTATDTTGVFTAKMANSAGADTSTLELKDDSASLKAAKAASDSSLSLASTKATLASQEVKLELD